MLKKLLLPTSQKLLVPSGVNKQQKKDIEYFSKKIVGTKSVRNHFLRKAYVIKANRKSNQSSCFHNNKYNSFVNETQIDTSSSSCNSRQCLTVFPSSLLGASASLFNHFFRDSSSSDGPKIPGPHPFLVQIRSAKYGVLDPCNLHLKTFFSL